MFFPPKWHFLRFFWNKEHKHGRVVDRQKGNRILGCIKNATETKLPRCQHVKIELIQNEWQSTKCCVITSRAKQNSQSARPKGSQRYKNQLGSIGIWTSVLFRVYYRISSDNSSSLIFRRSRLRGHQGLGPNLIANEEKVIPKARNSLADEKQTFKEVLKFVNFQNWCSEKNSPAELFEEMMQVCALA